MITRHNTGLGGPCDLPDLEGFQRGTRGGDSAGRAQLARVLRRGRRREARILPEVVQALGERGAAVDVPPARAHHLGRHAFPGLHI